MVIGATQTIQDDILDMNDRAAIVHRVGSKLERHDHSHTATLPCSLENFRRNLRGRRRLESSTLSWSPAGQHQAPSYQKSDHSCGAKFLAGPPRCQLDNCRNHSDRALPVVLRRLGRKDDSMAEPTLRAQTLTLYAPYGCVGVKVKSAPASAAGTRWGF